jgi:DNA-binding transcriptional LysR family regulator
MLKLESVAAFVVVAESGSISEAARRMELSKSVVSERLAELERSLGAKLLHRTTRKLAITEDGSTFYERAKRIVQEATDAAVEIAERRGELVGPLRVSGPVSFGSLHLGPALYGFLAKNPKIDLTLDLDDRFVSMLADGYDAVVRHGPVVDEHVVVKRLAPSRRFLVAAPAYLEKFGKPKSLAELEQHKGIVYSNRGLADWRFKASRGFVTVRPLRALRVNNGLLMRDAAATGLGLALLPAYFVHKELASKKLVIVDVGVEAEGATIYIAYPADRRGSAKVRALTVWLRDAFGDPPYWDLAPALTKP